MCVKIAPSFVYSSQQLRKVLKDEKNKINYKLYNLFIYALYRKIASDFFTLYTYIFIVARCFSTYSKSH